MYEIEYYEDDKAKTLMLKINSNHVPRSDDDVTIDGKQCRVLEVKHILNTGDTLEEKFIVTVHQYGI
jgi:predicted P-loop ATPase